MKTFIAIAATLIAGANGLVARASTCTFTLTASGGAFGTLAQLSDGQNRVGSTGLPVATYTIGADGGIYDQAGRGCILTPPTTQFQCDVGATPTTGFSIGCDGTLYYKGSSHFVACQTGDNGENVYTTSGLGQTGCVDITLKASACYAPCAPPPPPPAPKTCPAALSGAYEFPHLIIPISSKNPDKAYSTSYNGQVSDHDIASIFNFDIPAGDKGKTCSLVFLFPLQSQLQTSSFTFSGDGNVDFSLLAGVANSGTTYNNAPKVAKDYGTFNVKPGNSYTIATFDCPAGTAVSYEMAATGNTALNYFQDYNPSPIGLYITVC